MSSKQSAAARRRWADPDYRARCTAKLAANNADPAQIEKRREGQRLAWRDPDVRARRIAGISAARRRTEQAVTP